MHDMVDGPGDRTQLSIYTNSQPRIDQMELLHIESDRVQLQLTFEELLLINNALNEVCNGIDIPEFETRLGVTREAAEILLRQLNPVLSMKDV